MKTQKEIDKFNLLAGKKKYIIPSVGQEPCITCEDALSLMEEYAKQVKIQVEIDANVGFLRPSVKWFAERMEQTLRKNDHKVGWGKCDLQYLSMRLTQERKELSEAIASKDAERIINECSDVSNFSLMLADKFGNNYGK